MNQQELQHKLDGTKEQESFVISPQLDAMIRTLAAPERRMFMGKLWSLQRVYSGLYFIGKSICLFGQHSVGSVKRCVNNSRSLPVHNAIYYCQQSR